MSNKVLLATVTLIVFLLASAGAALGFYTWDRGQIAGGITIAGVEVSGLSLEEAKTKVSAKVSEINGSSLRFMVEGKSIEIKLSSLGLTIQADSAIDRAFQVGRDGNMAQKALSKRKAAQGLDFPLQTSWDEKTLAQTIEQNFSGYNVAPTDAAYSITPENTMLITPEKAGRHFDIQELVKTVKGINLLNPKEIEVKFQQDSPKLSASQLEAQKITGVVASYTTAFNPGQTNRVANIKLAAAALDGKVIRPGETFSFNEVVGDRNSDAGYKEAPVIYNGQLVPGLGGGVCQVSTTLYNVLLLADLPITERSNHSLVVGYVPLGQDATVSYPALDLRFKNDTANYLLIKSRVAYDTVTFFLYGQPKPERLVTITNEITSVIQAKEQRIIDTSLTRGTSIVQQQGSPGYFVNTYRSVKIHGELINKESLSTSAYQSTPRIIAFNP